MNPVVVDVSVAAKWVLPQPNEPFANEANELLQRYIDGQIRVLVPDLFWTELGNVLWKWARAGRCSAFVAATAMKSMCDRDFTIIPSFELIEQALDIAITFEQTVYDALYVALAVVSKTDLVTADDKLVRALAPHFPVKTIATFRI